MFRIVSESPVHRHYWIESYLFLILFAFTLLLIYPQATPIADGKEKFLGNITSRGIVPSNFKEYWNQITPENAGKWGNVEKTRDQMSWGRLDTSYNYAKDNGMPFKEHTFIWGNQEPGWIGNLSADEQRAEVEEWIKAYGERYPETDYIDVVNEPLHRPPSFKDAIGGDGSTGWDWIIRSFEMARKYCPDAKLVINEYDMLNNPGGSDQYITIINILKERNLVDLIGVQSHYFTIQGGTPLDMIKGILDNLAATGLPVYSTELDIQGDDSTQLRDYMNIFPVIWQHPGVVGVTLWGWIEKNTWAGNTHLVRSDGTERPALTWLRAYVKDPTKIADRPISPGRTVTPFSLRVTDDGRLFISVREPDDRSLLIVDLQGRAVEMPPLRYHFSPGVYPFAIRNAGGTVFTQKMLFGASTVSSPEHR